MLLDSQSKRVIYLDIVNVQIELVISLVHHLLQTTEKINQ